MRVGVCSGIAGQMRELGENLRCRGVKACFLFTPLWQAKAFMPIGVPHGCSWCGSSMLSSRERRGQSGRYAPPFDLTRSGHLSCGVCVCLETCKCELRFPPPTMLLLLLLFLAAASAGHVDGRVRRGGPGARDAGADGDQHLWQRGPARKWRGTFKK